MLASPIRYLAASMLCLKASCQGHSCIPVQDIPEYSGLSWTNQESGIQPKDYFCSFLSATIFGPRSAIGQANRLQSHGFDRMAQAFLDEAHTKQAKVFGAVPAGQGEFFGGDGVPTRGIRNGRFQNSRVALSSTVGLPSSLEGMHPPALPMPLTYFASGLACRDLHRHSCKQTETLPSGLGWGWGVFHSVLGL